jgi:hypothetical protein
MRADVSVTYEFDTVAPKNHRARSVEAASVPSVTRKAVNEARRALKPRGWSSVVIVINRLDGDE